MTPETAPRDDEPEPVTCAHYRRRLDRLLADWEQLMVVLAADPNRPDLARREAALTIAAREVRAQMAAHVFADAFTAQQAQKPAAAGRHRAAATAPVIPLRPRTRVAHGLAPAAVLATLAGHGTRHALTAHLKLGLTAAAAAGVTTAAVTYTIATMPDQRPVPVPAAAAPAAAPSAVTVPARHPRALARKHHPHRAPAPLLLSPAPSPTATPPPPPPATAPGVLNVQATTITLQQSAPGQYAGQLVITAAGGPVRWAVDWLGTSSALSFDQSSGGMQDGDIQVVTVTADASQVQAGQAGQWVITLNPGGQQITVTVAG